MFYLIVFVCSFLAFGISAICGGGAGLMLIPVLNRFYRWFRCLQLYQLVLPVALYPGLLFFIETLTGKLFVIFANSFAGSMAGKLAAELY